MQSSFESVIDSAKSERSFFCTEKVCLDSILVKAMEIGIILSIEDIDKNLRSLLNQQQL